MFRAAMRRSSPRTLSAFRQTALRTTPRRFASTAPADKKRSWKSSAVRWGLAIGAVYWYTTSSAFAEDSKSSYVEPPPQLSDEDLPTVEALVEEKRQEAEARLAKATATKEVTSAPSASDTTPLASEAAPSPSEASDTVTPPANPEGGAEELEAEADSQGAFDPETGEINWDCPCLGGMAHGTCGEEFKAAFSCFVYSKEEPKGMDCIEKFQHMQDCFRQHPEEYGDELADDEEDIPADATAGGDATPGKVAPLASDAAPDAVPKTTNKADSDVSPAVSSASASNAAEVKQTKAAKST